MLYCILPVKSHHIKKRHCFQCFRDKLKIFILQIYFDMYEQEKEQYEREMKIYHEQEQSRGMDREPNKGRESSEEVDAAAMEMEAQSAVNALMMDN